jgi:hypothetical protein
MEPKAERRRSKAETRRQRKGWRRERFGDYLVRLVSSLTVVPPPIIGGSFASPRTM